MGSAQASLSCSPPSHIWQPLPALLQLPARPPLLALPNYLRTISLTVVILQPPYSKLTGNPYGSPPAPQRLLGCWRRSVRQS